MIEQDMPALTWSIADELLRVRHEYEEARTMERPYWLACSDQLATMAYKYLPELVAAWKRVNP